MFVYIYFDTFKGPYTGKWHDFVLPLLGNVIRFRKRRIMMSVITFLSFRSTRFLMLLPCLTEK